MTDKVTGALKLVEQFESQGVTLPMEAEKLVAEIFRACGHDVSETGFIEDQEGVDCFFRTELEGKKQLIGVEVRSNTKPVPAFVVEKAFELKSTGHIDRVMVVASGGFTEGAIFHADAIGLGNVDLVDPNGLRNWIKKSNADPEEEVLPRHELIIKTAMEALAKEIAENPSALWAQEWRDLERILHVAFKGVGVKSVLTRSTKDGGFDLELTFDHNGVEEVYLVEVKHWVDKKPGTAELQKLIRVTTEREAKGGLLLSTSGFTQNICSGIAECEKPMRMGDSQKIIGICRTYARISSAFWTRLPNPYDILFEGTAGIPKN